MTTPQERTRALRFGWEFMIELRAAEDLNDGQRSTIEEILRHYPTPSEVKQWAQECAHEENDFCQLAPEGLDALSSANPSIPENLERGPTRPVDRTRALISAYALFRIDLIRADNLTAEQRRQIPYVLRHFPAGHEINSWAQMDAWEAQNNPGSKQWLAIEESS